MWFRVVRRRLTIEPTCDACCSAAAVVQTHSTVRNWWRWRADNCSVAAAAAAVMMTADDTAAASAVTSSASAAAAAVLAMV